MKYATDHAFRTALEAHIKMRASDSIGVSRLRKRIVFERLLARLVAQAPGEWVLKGGFALELRLGNVARSTKDADFEWRLPEEAAIELLLDASALDLGDRFTFALEHADAEPDPLGGGQRWRITATLAGRIFERAVIDVAFSAAPVHTPDEVTTSNLLQFADIDAVEVPTLGIEQHLAEKLHAYTREYSGGRRSTRVKDLVDTVLAERGEPALRDGVTAHALRKTYFTFLHEAGVPPRWVADQGGHSDPSTSLRIYTESLRDRERSQHGKAFDDLIIGNGDRDADTAPPRPAR